MVGEQQTGREAPTFSFVFEGEVELSAGDIWPDGDAPENPTTQDVVARIQTRWWRIDRFMREWNLTDDVHLYVDSEKAL